MTVIFRFIAGALLAGGLALWLQFEFPLNLMVTLGVGVLAAIWGDKFILEFMSLMRYFR